MRTINLFTILTISLFIFFIYSCSNRLEYGNYRLHDLSKKVSDTLCFGNSNNINFVEIFIKGNIKGEAVIEFDNGVSRYNVLKLRGVVNQRYYSEWYENKIRFIYTPYANIEGDSLSITYRMY